MDTYESSWRDFHHHAYECLRGSSFELRHYHEPPLASGLVLPALGRKAGYALFRITRYSVIGVAARWEISLDALLSTTDLRAGLTHEVKATCAPVDPDEVDDLVNALLAAPIPAMPGRGSMGVDGASYELEFGEAMHGARFHWWLQPPSGWGPLSAFFHGMSRLIEEGIEQSQSRFGGWQPDEP
jgi:hypothetical protein